MKKYTKKVKKSRFVECLTNKNDKHYGQNKTLIQQFLSYYHKSRINKILIIIALVATMIRIYMAIKTPLFAQAGADYDDFLMVKYAYNILEGDWLGTFGLRTLAKGASFAIFLVFAYLLGIPYSVALIGTYIFAIIIFIIAIRKMIPNKWFLFCSYLFLLFSPVMFHIENTQKIYRGGVIVAFSLLVISAMIGLYANRREKLAKILPWSILSGLSLSFFWFLKEDSIWILPFVLGAIILIIIDFVHRRSVTKKIFQKTFVVVLPLIMLAMANLGYCFTNYIHYGVFTVTDRNGTYFKEMIHNLLLIQDNQDIENVWITKNMMYQAIDVSPTLQTIKEEINDMYENSWGLEENGEINGDIIYWTIKEAVNQAGIYKQGGKVVNEFYEQVTEELKEAFNNAELMKRDAIFLSSVAQGLEKKDFSYFNSTTVEAIDMLVTYSQNETSVNVATGPDSDIILMEHLTNSNIIFPNASRKITKNFTDIISLANHIVDWYSIIGWSLFVLGWIGFIVLTVQVVIGIKKKDCQHLPLWLTALGLLGTMIILLFGVEWFCNWFESSKMRYIYNYTCGMIPLLQIFELIGTYSCIKIIYDLYKRKRKKKKCLQEL